MRGWILLSGSVYAEKHADEDALWMRKAKDGSIWTLRFELGADVSSELPRYMATIKRLDMSEISDKSKADALKSYGWTLTTDETGASAILCPHSGDWIAQGAEHVERALVECLVSWGLGAPLHEESSDTHAIRVRGKARREAERLMRDASACESALDTPVNKIGQTAREYGNGEDPIGRILMMGGPEGNAMRKLHGLG